MFSIKWLILNKVIFDYKDFCKCVGEKYNFEGCLNYFMVVYMNIFI